MKADQLDAMLIVPSEELRLMIGIKPLRCERFQGLFIKSDGDYFYFCNLLSGDEVQEALGDEKVYTWFDNDNFTEILKDLMASQGLIGKTVGVNATARAFNIKRIEEAMEVTFVDGKGIIEQLNMIKSSEELQGLRVASKLADEVMKEAISFIRPGMSEKQIVDKIEESFISRGCLPDFALVASGPNSALPHYTGTDRIILEKDIVLMDIGAKFNGFSSDITRTVFVGEPSEKMKEVYELVYRANLEGEWSSKIGIPVKEIDRAAREVIVSGGYGQFFTTRLGHGIGYSTHEEPYINQLNDKILAPGMAFTIEPGIYLRDQFGIRIEDTVIMTETGLEILNHVRKTVIVV
jgi:Xaa-Pro dipeptidase